MKKILLFGFDVLPEILAVANIARRFGAEAVPVGRENCGLTLDDLSKGRTGGSAPALLPGRMLVLCGLERDLDGLLPALAQGGIVCPKAILTAANRGWAPGRLYQELERERRAMGGR